MRFRNCIVLPAAVILFFMTANALAVSTGAYLGVEGGYINNASQFDTQGPSNEQVNTSSANVTSSIYAGYQIAYSNHLYLGLEVYGDFNTLSSMNQVIANETIVSVAVPFDWGGGLNPGVVLCKNTWIYAHVGLVGGQMRSDVVPSNTDVGSIYSDYRLGWQVGGGLGYMILEHLSLRLQYIYTHYASYQQDILANNITNVIHPWTNQATLGIAYYF